MGDAIAATLIAGRPYDSNEAFLVQLTQLMAADDLAASYYHPALARAGKAELSSEVNTAAIIV